MGGQRRICWYCGEPLVRHGDERPNRFAKRRYCGRLCQVRARWGGDRAVTASPRPPARHRPALDTWHTRAACLGTDTELFFHPDGERGPARAAREAKAKAMCAVCPVRVDCLRYALARQEPHGVFGGLSEAERKVILSRHKESAR